MNQINENLQTTLQVIADKLRIHSMVMTTEAGSGHPTSSLSAAEIMSALFFHVMRYDPAHIDYLDNDEFVLSKGHASPVLYAALAEAGVLPVTELTNLRKLHSLLEGHPVPAIPGVKVATGSLGQGLSAGLGMAYAMKLDHLDHRVYVLLGDGEMAEGSVWEALDYAPQLKLENICAILDMNRLGQSDPTMFGWDGELFKARLETFGWYTMLVDGHNIKELLNAFEEGQKQKQPVFIIARTVKGKGVSFLENEDGFHGKALSREQLKAAIKEICKRYPDCYLLQDAIPPEDKPDEMIPANAKSEPAKGNTLISKFTPQSFKTALCEKQLLPPLTLATNYSKGEEVATRKAYGQALVKLGKQAAQMLVLDGDVKNSTYTELFFKAFPERSLECYIAEQNMVGMAVGLQARGKRVFLATFAAFLTRAHDQIRMAAYSEANLKVCGSHSGVSIGEDGPSQMGLEDLAMFRSVFGSVVFSAADAVAAEKLTCLSANFPGVSYVRTMRSATPVIYDNTEEFKIGGAKLIWENPEAKITIVATGITVHEALKAARSLAQEQIPVNVIDCYSLKPIDTDLLRSMARKTKKVITVEDHYSEGGLGEAVTREVTDLAQVSVLAVSRLPHSGAPHELLQAQGIDETGIVQHVKSLLAGLGFKS